MDPVTHILLGAAVAQLPQPSTEAQLLPELSWKKRISIGAVAAIFPDIDYILFLWDPLEFLAYWHRAETHSLLLAPLWAWLLTMLWLRYFGSHQHKSLILSICLAAILSHTLIDSFTTFGTKWFAPVSDYQVSWNLLFVVDIYFTLTILITLILLIFWRKHRYRLCAVIAPVAYLALILILKQNAYNQLASVSLPGAKSSPELILLPQPLSPFFWQVIAPTDHGGRQAYLKLANDEIAAQLAELLWGESAQKSYQLPQQLNWHRYSVTPHRSDWQQAADQVWRHESFRSFRQFAHYPVFYDYQQGLNNTCVWFSDLRYHSPNAFPSFRIGMCRKEQQPWQLYRIKYFSRDQMEIIRPYY